MKKVLFASTALVASAGIAAAEVSLSGSAEIGIFGGDDLETQFHTDVDVTFTLSGATDNGITFGGSIDLDESDGDGVDYVGDSDFNSDAFDNNAQGGESLFVSGSFGTLTMGDTDGAFDWALTEAIIGGDIIDSNEHGGYSGNSGLDGFTNGDQGGDGQIARYEYSFGDFSFALSAEIDTDDGDDDDTVWGLGGRYAADLGNVNLGFGLGWQTKDDFNIFGVSMDARFGGGFRGIINYSDLDGAGGADDHIGLALGYTFDAWTFAANWGRFTGDGGGDRDGWAIIVNYDLGGGAELQAGWGNTDPEGADDTSVYSFGLSMAF